MVIMGDAVNVIVVIFLVRFWKRGDLLLKVYELFWMRFILGRFSGEYVSNLNTLEKTYKIF